MSEFMAGGRRRVDRGLAPHFLVGVSELGLDEIRSRRADAEQEEGDLSYARRLLQGRLDILRAEQGTPPTRGGGGAGGPPGGGRGAPAAPAARWCVPRGPTWRSSARCPGSWPTGRAPTTGWAATWAASSRAGWVSTAGRPSAPSPTSVRPISG